MFIDRCSWSGGFATARVYQSIPGVVSRGVNVGDLCFRHHTTKGRAQAVAQCVRSVFGGSYQQFGSSSLIRALMTRPVTRSRRSWAARASTTFATIGLVSARRLREYGHCNEPGGDHRDPGRRCDGALRLDGEPCRRIRCRPELQFICGKLTAPPFDWRTEYMPAFDPEKTSEPLTKWTMPIFAAGGANFSMRRALFDRVGGYDEFCGPGADSAPPTTEICRSASCAAARNGRQARMSR